MGNEKRKVDIDSFEYKYSEEEINKIKQIQKDQSTYYIVIDPADPNPTFSVTNTTK